MFAVRAGPPLANNLRKALLGQSPLDPWEPQEVFLGIIGTGSEKLAIASRGCLALESEWVWLLKDWIDRKWMKGNGVIIGGNIT